MKHQFKYFTLVLLLVIFFSNREIKAQDANAGNDKTICLENTSLYAVQPADGVGIWSLVSGKGAIDNSANRASGVTNLAQGANVFRWTVTFNDNTAYDEVTITNNKVTADAGEDMIECAAQTSITRNEFGTISGLWSPVYNSAIISDPTSNVVEITNLALYANTFQWKVYNNDCSAVDEVMVNKNLVTANAGGDIESCDFETDMEAEVPYSFEDGYWSVVEGNGSFDDSELYNTHVRFVGLGVNRFRWTIVGIGCENSDIVVVTNNYVEANAGENQSLCSDQATIVATEAERGSGLWTSMSSVPVLETPSSNISNVSELTKGVNVFRWTVKLGLCTAISNVSVYNDIPSEANVEDIKSVCISESSVSAIEPLIGNGYWTVTSGDAIVTTSNHYTSLVDNLSFGANTFRWTIRNNDCSLFDNLTITNNKISVATSNDQEICETFTDISAPDTYSGYWTTPNSEFIISDISSANTSVSNLSQGLNIFRWTANYNGCTASDEINIINNLPSIPVILTQEQESCFNYIELLAVDPPKGNGYWEIIQGNATIVSPSNYRTDVIDLQHGTNIFRWTVENNGCTLFEEVGATNQMATAKIITDKIDVCTTSATIQAETPEFGNGKWSIISGLATIQDENATQTLVNEMSKGLYHLRWHVTYNDCTSYDDMVITNNQPSLAQVQEDREICENTINIVGNNPSSGTGEWSLVSGGGTIVSPNSPTTMLTDLKSGASVFRWTVAFAECSNIDEVTITSNYVDSYAGIDQQLCGTTYQMNAVLPPEGSTAMWVLESGDGDIANSAQNNTMITNLAEGANTFRWRVSLNECSSSSQIILTNNKYSANAGNDNETCNREIVLNATDIPYISGEWTVVEGDGIVTDKSVSNTDVLNLSRGQNTFRWNYNINNCYTYDEVTIISNAVEVDAGSDEIICEGSATQLNANNPTNGTGEWSIFTGSGNFQNTNLYNTTITNIGDGGNFLYWTVTEGDCTGVDMVIIKNNEFHITLKADDEICETDYILKAQDLEPTATGLWEVIIGEAVIEDVSNNISNATNVLQDENKFRWTVFKGGCTDSKELMVINNFYEANAGIDQVICSLSTSLDATFTDELVSHEATGSWELISGGAVFSAPSNQAGIANSYPNPTISGLKKGDNYFRWTITVGKCKDYDELVITNNAVYAFAGNSQFLCETYSNLNANEPSTDETGVWTPINNTDIVFDNNAFFNTRVTGLLPGANTFKWEITGNGCSASSFVDIINSTFTAEAGDNLLINDDVANLSAQLETDQTGEWLILQGNAIIEDVHSPTSGLSGIGPGINIFRWLVTNNICNNYDDIIIIFEDGRATVERHEIYTCDDSVQVRAYLPKSGQYGWEFVSGDYKIRTPDKTETWLYDLATGKHVIKWYLNQNGYVTEDSTIIYHSMGVDAGQDFTVCDLDAGYMNGEVPLRQIDSLATGTWVLIAGTARIFNENLYNSKIINLKEGELNRAIWEVRRLPKMGIRYCINRDTVEFTYRTPPFARFDVTQPVSRYPDAIVEVENKTATGNISYEWDYGDGTVLSEYSPQAHKYLEWGVAPNWTIPLKLSVKNEYCTDDSIIQVLVLQPPPFTNKSFDNQGCAPFSIVFSNDDIQSTESVSWDFGDGIIETTANPTHTYSDAGNYTIKIQARDEITMEMIDIAENEIVVRDIPEIDFSFDSYMSGNSPVLTFQNLTKYAEIYTWEFGDGERSLVENPVHTFPDENEYEIKITALNECGINSLVRNIVASNIEDNQLVKFDIYPNPAHKSFVIELNDEAEFDSQIKIFDMSGKIVYRNELKNKKTFIRFNNLPSSIYIIEIVSGKNIARKKLLILE